MNPIYSAAADAMQSGLLMGLMTAFFLVFFLGWTWWAYRPSAASDMEAASRMPLDDGGAP
jgi:cbb3-type cytochrome oxidase subunit 3